MNSTQKIIRYKHSGVMGDLIYSLALCQHFGPGEFYLHMDQINWIGQHYYNSPPNPLHQGRMNQQDFEFLKDFLQTQPYIKNFDVMSNSTEITHNLDRFRPLFVGHPGNYVDVYCWTFGIKDPDTRFQIRTTPWLKTDNTRREQGRSIVINRTERWLPPTLSPQWSRWHEQGVEDKAIFLGFEHEHALFQEQTGWRIPHVKTDSMKDLAEYIAGADVFIGNQSQCLALAIGLGRPYWAELRRDLPRERNECWFNEQPNSNYF